MVYERCQTKLEFRGLADDDDDLGDAVDDDDAGDDDDDAGDYEAGDEDDIPVQHCIPSPALCSLTSISSLEIYLDQSFQIILILAFVMMAMHSM